MTWQEPAPPVLEMDRQRFLSSCGVMDAPPDERFDRLARLAARVYQADIAFVSFVDHNTQWLAAMTAAGLSPSIRRDHSICQVMVATGQPLVVGDFTQDPRFAGHPVVPSLAFRSYAGVPVLAEGRFAIGSICILNRDPFDPDTFDIGPLFDLAAAASDAVMLVRQNHRLAAESRTDPLTGIANRRGLDEVLDRAMRRVRRTGDDLSLLALDLDFFQRLNERSGHAAGDEALCRFAEIMVAAASRPDDFVARNGGEEFVIVLPSTDAGGARHCAQRIQDDLQAAAIANPAAPRGIVTVSIGIATTNDGATSTADLQKQADEALYAAKAGGRNQFVEYAASGSIGSEASAA